MNNTKEKALLSGAKKTFFGLLLPLIFGTLVFWLMGVDIHGEGPSAGGRGMVLFLVFFPIGFVAAALLNTWIFFVPLRGRLATFLLGSIIPALELGLAHAYLWRLWPFQFV